MGDLSQVLAGPLAGLGFGGIAGAIVGYTAKKIAKLAAIFLGIVFITLQVLAYYGFVTVNWTAVETTAVDAWTDQQGQTLAARAWHVIAANLPFGGGFLGGFLIGFKLG